MHTSFFESLDGCKVAVELQWQDSMGSDKKRCIGHLRSARLRQNVHASSMTEGQGIPPRKWVCKPMANSTQGLNQMVRSLPLYYTPKKKAKFNHCPTMPHLHCYRSSPTALGAGDFSRKVTISHTNSRSLETQHQDIFLRPLYYARQEGPQEPLNLEKPTLKLLSKLDNPNKLVAERPQNFWAEIFGNLGRCVPAGTPAAKRPE